MNRYSLLKTGLEWDVINRLISGLRDDEWRQTMAGSGKITMTGLTLPAGLLPFPGLLKA